MKFIPSDIIPEEVISKQRLNLRTEIEYPNSSVLNGDFRVKFVNRTSDISSITDTIELTINEQDESQFDTIVEGLNEVTFNFNDFDYNRPINREKLSVFETKGKLASYSISSTVNYYDEEIDNFMSFVGGNANIYKDSFKAERPTKRSIKSRYSSESEFATRSIFDSNTNFTQANKNKHLYPCYTEISLIKDEPEAFRQVLNDLNLFNCFLQESDLRLEKRKTFIDKKAETIGEYSFNALEEIVANLQSFESNTLIASDTRKIKTNINFLDKLEALGQLQKNSLYHSNFKKVIENSKVPSETIYYKITKFAGATPVQEFLIPNKGDVLNFIDTEVIYNNTYSYQIVAFVVVYGVTCEYSLVSSDFTNKKATFQVTSEPTPILMEIFVSMDEVLIETKAPLVPSVKFINRPDNKNSVTMAFMSKQGSSRDYFVRILDEDDDIDMRADPVDFKNRFEYNKEPLKIQVMRLNKKPDSILDFKSSVPFVIESDFEFNDELVLYNDVVFPNRKYYYIFRALSASGKVSNPTPVFEVELLKDADSTKVVVSTVEVDAEKEITKTIKMRNLLQVRPALRHTVVRDLSASRININNTFLGPLGQFAVGESTDPIWGRKFKLRVRSNESGKIIDININFDLIKDIKVEDL